MLVRKLRKVRELGFTGTLRRVASLPRDIAVRTFPSVLLLPAARAVREQTGKPVVSQVREMIALRRGAGRVRPFDYFAYDLYDDSRYTPAAKREFVGWNYDESLERLWSVNDPGWAAICDDKLIAYALFRGLGLPFPEVLAVYHPGGRTYGGVPCLRNPAEMAAFLRDGIRYPFFGKPAGDAFGRGASSIAGIDRDRDMLVQADGTEIRVAEYVREFPSSQYGRRKKGVRGMPGGYIFQERIVQHPLIERISGSRVSSLRMVVLQGHDGPRLFRVTWKLPVGRNITDHAIGTSGNIKCSVDPATGRVEIVLQGRGPAGTAVYGLNHHGTPIEAHPDTGERLLGIELPEWDRTVALCLHAAAALPGLRYQSWDMVMGANGPLMLEINAQGGIAQMPGGRGLNDADFRRFMADADSQ